MTVEIYTKTETEDLVKEIISALPAGPQGEPGPAGSPGGPGADGAAGADGIDGKDGRDGVDGQPGDDGAPGKDGLPGIAYGLWLDSFNGTTDDIKLDAAIAASQTGNVRRPILLSNRTHTFARARTLTSGFKLINPYGFGNQLRGANSIPCHVQFTGTGVWWTLAPGSVFDVEFTGIGFTSTTGTAQFASSGSSVLWTSKLHDLGFLNWAGVLGSATDKFQHTAIELSGWWNVNNARGTSFNLGGSDSNLWTNGMLIDAGSKQMPPDLYHIRFSSTQKSNVGPIYMTAENVKGIYVSGSSSDGHLVFDKMRVEGRNAGAPSNGLMHIASGRVKVCNSWFGYTKADYITQAGGELILSGCDFGVASVVGTTRPPVLKQTGGNATVRDLTTNWGTPPTTTGPNITNN